MVFIAIYKAVYDYAPQDENEIAITEGDVLCILEKGDDDWWKAKKKAQSNEEDEPEGLIPCNYIEEATPVGKAKALYEYTRQTDEELSFAEESVLDVYDTTDEDWTLVGLNREYGFVPANYIELEEAPPPMPVRPRAASQPHVEEPEPQLPPRRTPSLSPPDDSVQSPAAALAGIMGSRTNGSAAPASRSTPLPPPDITPLRKQVQFTPEESEEESPAPRLPRRPAAEPSEPIRSRERTKPKHVQIMEPESDSPGVVHSPPHNRVVSQVYDEDSFAQSPGGFHMYNIYEMVEVMGKNRKTPVTLGINIGKRIIMISAGESRDSREWSADKLSNYSQEGKHVFVELVRPSKSVDFHAGQSETAKAIVADLSELKTSIKADNLDSIFSSSEKLGKMLYDFKATASDEVSVKADEEVIVLDDTKSEEWWLVRRTKNGKQGMVPSSYVEVTGALTTAASVSRSNTKSAKSTRPNYVEQNRLEEERLAREASKASKSEVGPGMRLPERGSSLTEEKRKSSMKSKDSRSSQRPMPDSRKIRTWTDASGGFKVQAEFIGLKDHKIHLHKSNGVKIAVPVEKMSIDDLEYVENATGASLADEKALASVKRKRSTREPTSRAGATIERKPGKPEYDWFPFFLECGVNYQICERYAAAFRRDELREENLPDITSTLLRNLGFKEGDNLRVMKFLDNKFTRNKIAASSTEGAAGLFTMDGGALRNNTQRRPTPANPAKDAVDADAFKPKVATQNGEATSSTSKSPVEPKLIGGFDDDAWKPRQSKTPTPAAKPASPPAPAAPVQPALTGAAQDLSGLDLLTPLRPTPAPVPVPAPKPNTQTDSPAPPPQLPGATPSLFDQLGKSASQVPSTQFAPPRQRPQAPMQTQTQNSLISPPPARAASAPQNQQSAFQPPPLQPQLTGYPGQLQMQAQAPPTGQSLQELSQRRAMQAQGLMPQATGYGLQMQGLTQMGNGLMPQQTGYNQFQQPNGMGFGQFQQPQQTGFQQPQQTGFQPQQTGFQPSMQQALMAGQQTGSPFADPPIAPYQPMQPQQTGINAFLPPPLIPQRTGPAPPTSFGTNGYNGQAPPVPPMPQSTPAPLIPQKTGPAPPVRFGVNAPKKLAPQPTGKKANLSQATPDNPFGF